MTTRRTQAERRADSEQRLLRAAAELIVERGMENTSLADIGRRAGASHAAVNHRFGSKDELVDRLIEKAGLFHGNIALARIGERTGLDALLQLCDSYLALVDGPNPLGRVHVVLWSEAIAHTAERRAAHSEWDRQFRAVVAAYLEDAIAEGDVDPGLGVADAALSIVGTVRGIAMQLLLDPDATELETARRTVAVLVRDAVKRPASA
ncbi:MAG: TetR/AcrR family transcriptional regulator [Nocardioidaceae bacterium]|nr:TetR/AcrR family transcriptional regulator [Nocardioidaceae bacterium]